MKMCKTAPVTRCSTAPRTFGFWPGALNWNLVRLLKCSLDRTGKAQSHGKPNIDPTAFNIDNLKKFCPNLRTKLLLVRYDTLIQTFTGPDYADKHSKQERHKSFIKILHEQIEVISRSFLELIRMVRQDHSEIGLESYTWAWGPNRVLMISLLHTTPGIKNVTFKPRHKE